MSQLVKNTMPAERLRGCVWAENFESREAVVHNSGEVFGNPVFEKGGVNLNGTTDYVKYNLTGHEFNSDEISIVLEFVPDFATNDDSIRYLFNTSSGKRYLVAKRENGFTTPNGLVIRLGETVIGTVSEATYSPYWYVGARNVLVISGTSGNTNVWLNGNLILSSAIAWTPDNPTELYVGSDYTIASFFDGVVIGFNVFKSSLTAQEALDYYTQKTFRYMEEAVLNLTMMAENHDPSNTTGVQLVTDGDMEAVGTSAWIANSGAVLTKESDGAGGQVLRVKTLNGDITSQARQDVLTSGKKYRIAGRYRSVDGIGTAQVGANGDLRTLGTSITFENFSVVTIATDAVFFLACYHAAADEDVSVEYDDIVVEEMEARTLDRSGNANHAIFGDGATPTKYPDKLGKRGYGKTFSGAYLATESLGATNTGKITAAILVTNKSTSTEVLIDVGGDGVLNEIAGLFLDVASINQLRFYAGGDSSLNAAVSESNKGRTFTAIGVHDGVNTSIYIDGIKGTNASTPLPPILSNNTIYTSFVRSNKSANLTSTDTEIHAALVWLKGLTPIQILDLHLRLTKRVNYV